MAAAYDLDFHAWALAQADALRRRSANEVDWDHLAEELESLGRSDVRELGSRLQVLLVHLLKWRFQPGRRCTSWRHTIRVQRRDLARFLKDSPSLRSLENAEFEEAYASARLLASAETHIPLADFPEAPLFTLEQAADPSWLPD